jgi:hypothetical protein
MATHKKYGRVNQSAGIAIQMLTSTLQGPIIRVAPNTVMISDPQTFQAHHTFDKSEWWLSFRGASWPVPHGTELSQKVHNVKKRRVAAGVMKSVLLTGLQLTAPTVRDELCVEERAVHGQYDHPNDGATLHEVCSDRSNL